MRRSTRLPVLRRRGAIALPLLILAWLTAVGIGLVALWDVDSAAGVAGRPPDHWPEESRIARALGKPTLVMLVHPRCACSRASLEELDRILARVGDGVAARVVFVNPRGSEDDSTATPLWRNATAIRGVTAIRDDDGAEARRFQVWTSGETLLYDAEGRLMFAGGITGSRGHAGDNAGQQALLAAILDASPGTRSTSVYGCALDASDAPVSIAAERG